MADVAAKTAKSDITKRSDVLRFAGKLLSVFFVVALLCAVLPTRATGEEPALFRASLMYNDTTNAAKSYMSRSLTCWRRKKRSAASSARMTVSATTSPSTLFPSMSST